MALGWDAHSDFVLRVFSDFESFQLKFAISARKCRLVVSTQEEGKAKKKSF
jgi:hypothetical protein